jgi:DNA-binding NarL/FixJ family response regulator
VQVKKRVLIIDDHLCIRQGMVQLLNQQKNLVVCGESEDGEDISNLIKSTRPDIAIIDLSLKNKSGLIIIENIKMEFPDLPILVLSLHDENIYIEQVLKLGCNGYLMKHEAANKIIYAIENVLAGKYFVHGKTYSDLLKRKVV